MRSRWRNALTLGLATVYMAVVMFGHAFHNHTIGHRPHGSCACRTDCEEHHHLNGVCQSHSTTLDRCQAVSGEPAGHCSICSFYSHHGVPVHLADVVTVGRVPDQIVASLNPIEAVFVYLAHQPRAPPQIV